MTLSLNATHPSNGETEYNLHNLYGLMMAKTTFEYLTSNSSGYEDYEFLPFILSRSTFAGSGQYTSHWLGDNWRDWRYMNFSIAGIMNFNMFGIPLVGADVCGFFGENKDDEMCARWIQLATFYPFARYHIIHLLMVL
jgi:alpha-glucosidase